MAITGVSLANFNNSNMVNFKGKKSENSQYENPISRSTERNLTILSSVGASALAGGIAGGLTTLCTKGKKLPIGVGIAAALGTLAKIYNTNVNAFAREKEMDVFSRQKEAQSNIYEDINNEIKDENVSLDDKINHYSTVKMADNGNGVMVKGA